GRGGVGVEDSTLLAAVRKPTGDNRMTIARRPDRRPLLADKSAARRLAAEIDQRLGVVIDPTATAEVAQEMMLAHGIRPADCEFSRDLMRLRDQTPDDARA